MDTLLEVLAYVALMFVATFVIGVPVFIFVRWRDQKNAPASGPDELHYIELSRQQKKDGWSFQQRYQFLGDAGFRKHNIDAILGQVERFQPVVVTAEELERESKEVLAESTNTERDAFLLRTYAGFRAGKLAHVVEIYSQQEAKAKRVKQFVNLYRDLVGETIEFCLGQRKFDNDEILVAFDSNNFLLTSKALYLFRKKHSYVLIRILKLEDIQDYTTQGWWTFKINFRLKSGENVVVNGMDKVPKDELMRELLSHGT